MDRFFRDTQNINRQLAMTDNTERPLTLEEITAKYKGEQQAEYIRFMLTNNDNARRTITEILENKVRELWAESATKDKEIERLKRTRDEMFSLWEPVDEYVRNLPTTRLGESVSGKALEMLKENARLKKELELSNLILATSTECWKSENALLKERIEAAEELIGRFDFDDEFLTATLRPIYKTFKAALEKYNSLKPFTGKK